MSRKYDLLCFRSIAERYLRWEHGERVAKTRIADLEHVDGTLAFVNLGKAETSCQHYNLEDARRWARRVQAASAFMQARENEERETWEACTFAVLTKDKRIIVI